MPRDGTGTRELLLLAAEELFARRGLHQATTREITSAAGQRNSSALTYHFGSRAAVLHEILERHGTPLDEQRAELTSEPLDAEPTRRLVAALVIPYAGCLRTHDGRNYLRIVGQLTDQFPAWRIEGELTPPALRRILAVLESRCDTPPAIARERLVGVIMLMTAAVAERARLIEREAVLELDHEAFGANLVDMLVGCIEAPVGPPLPPPVDREPR